MAQSDYNIGANPSGLAMRTEINTIFDSILSHNSGSTAPTVTSAFMMWMDTSNATCYYLKMRNHDNTAWVTLGIYTVATKVYTSYTEDTIKLTGNQDIVGIKNFTNKILTPNVSYKDSPITITSWSYVGATITLNVNSHTFVDGDYIEVSGLTSTTYPANGIHLVTSATSTTIVFTLGATPTGTTGVSSATVKGYTTINGRVSEILGGNQTLLDVTANRVVGSTYYNTSGKPKIITANVYSNTAPAQVIIIVNGDNTYFSTVELTSLSGMGVFGIIPIGASYSISITDGGVGTINKWKEG